MLSVAAITFMGLAALCLAMDKHFGELLKRKPTARQLLGLRVLGWVLLGLAPGLAVAQRGLAHGLVEWSAVLMAGLVVWVFVKPYQPRALLTMAGVGAVMAPVLWVMGY